MNNSDIKDKAVFILGFLAVFLTLSTFKNQLIEISIPVKDHTYTVWDMVVLLLIFMMISGYLYALSYIRYSFGRYQEWRIIQWSFKTVIFFANLFYSVALLLPLTAILISTINGSALYLFAQKHVRVVEMFDTISIVSMITGAVINAWVLSKKGNKVNGTINNLVKQIKHFTNFVILKLK